MVSDPGLSEAPLSIKPLTPADAQAVSTLHLYIWKQAYAPIFGADRLQHLPQEESRATWLERMHASGYNGLGLWQQERFVGFAGWGEIAPTTAEIFHFYLHPDLWGGGTASWFMQHLLQLLQHKGYLQVVLWVLKGNERAQRFYQKQGFVPAHLEKQRHKWALTLEEVQFSNSLI